jgi:type II secretory pathway pseudopilin PulG
MHHRHKKDFLSRSQQKGFSLLALMIVIVLLGGLVAASIASLDPFEQFNKTRDEKLQNDATNFISGNVEYFTKHNALPWFSSAEKGNACLGAKYTVPSLALRDINNCINLLINEGELSQDFASTTNMNNLILTNPNPATGKNLDSVICFMPISKVHQQDENTKYNYDGTDTTPNYCKSEGGTNDCYWCTQ